MGTCPEKYEISVEGKPGTDWLEWFSAKRVPRGVGEETTIAGTVPDQAVLLGLLGVRDHNLTLFSVKLQGGRPFARAAMRINPSTSAVPATPNSGRGNERRVQDE